MQPTDAIKRYDLSITYREFSLEANQAGFVGLQVMPAIPVSEQHAEFDRLTVKGLLAPVADTRRSPDGSYKRLSGEWEKHTYKTDEHGVEEPVDDRQAAIYRDHLWYEQAIASRAINRVLLAFENEVATLAQDTSQLSNAPAAATWSTKDTAKPIDDVDACIQRVKDQCGFRANALVFTDLNWRHFKRTKQVEDLLKYSGWDDPKDLMGARTAIAELFDVPIVLVADSVKNTANKGLAASFGGVWNNAVFGAYRISTSPDLSAPSATFGRTMMYSDPNENIMPGAEDAVMSVIVEEYREEARRGGVIRARCDYDINLIYADAASLVTGVL